MNKLKMCIDMDEVIYPFLTQAISICNLKNNTNYQIQDVKSYFDVPTMIRDCFKDVDYTWYEKDNAIKYVEMFCNSYDVYILTASMLENLINKVAWIEKYLPYIGWNKTIVGKNKQMIECDIIIDDAEHNLIEHKAKYKFLIDMPYNENFCNEQYDIVRVKNLNEVMEVLNEIEL